MLAHGIIIILIIDNRLNIVVASISLRCVQACSVGRDSGRLHKQVGQIMGHHWIRITNSPGLAPCTFAGLHFRDRRVSCIMLLLDFEAFGVTYLERLLGSMKCCKMQTLVTNFGTREPRASIHLLLHHPTEFPPLGKEPTGNRIVICPLWLSEASQSSLSDDRNYNPPQRISRPLGFWLDDLRLQNPASQHARLENASMGHGIGGMLQVKTLTVDDPEFCSPSGATKRNVDATTARNARPSSAA